MLDLVRTFVLDGTSHEITIHVDDDDNPLFLASDVGRVLGIHNVHHALTSFKDDVKPIVSNDRLGHVRQMSFITEDVMTLLIMRSRKPIARRFQRWVVSVISEIRKTGEYRLRDELAERETRIADIEARAEHARKSAKEELETALRAANRRAAYDIFAATHSVLIDMHRSPTNVVYIGFIRLHGDDGKFLIKIGSTGNIAQRVFQLRATYGDLLLVGVYPCDRHVDFEKRFLLTHPFVTARHHFDDGDNSMEVFLVSQTDLDEIKRIAATNVHKYDHPLRPVPDIASESTPPETAAAVTTTVQRSTGRRSTSSGFRVQRYSEDGERLLAVYETWVAACRDPAVQIENHGPPSAQKMAESVETRQVFRGFRWATIPRDQPADTQQNIGETKTKNRYVKGMIAVLDVDGKVSRVFASAKDAAAGLGKTGPAISKALHSSGKGHGYVVRRWDDCTASQRRAYTDAHELPCPVRSSNTARALEKLDPVTGEVVGRFDTVKRALDAIGTSNYGCMNDAIKRDATYAGFRWRYAVEGSSS